MPGYILLLVSRARMANCRDRDRNCWASACSIRDPAAAWLRRDVPAWMLARAMLRLPGPARLREAVPARPGAGGATGYPAERDGIAPGLRIAPVPWRSVRTIRDGRPPRPRLAACWRNSPTVRGNASPTAATTAPTSAMPGTHRPAAANGPFRTTPRSPGSAIASRSCPWQAQGLATTPRCDRCAHTFFSTIAIAATVTSWLGP